MSRPEDQSFCLVVPPRGLSWLIVSLPSLKALSASGRRLVIMTEQRRIPLLEMSAIEPRPLSWFEDQAPDVASYDEAMLWRSSLKDAWWARREGISKRWGYRGGLKSLLLSCAVKPPSDRHRHATEKFRELLAAAGAELPAEPEPRLTPTRKLLERGRERLRRAQQPIDETPLVGVYVGAQEGGSGRAWPRADFEELLRQLRRRHPGWRYLLFTTLADLWTAVKIFEETGKIHPVLGPELDIADLTAVFAQLDLLIGADSWMLQLAAAAGARTLGLFARDPRSWAPRGARHGVILASGASLAAIEVDEVLSQVDEMLGDDPATTARHKVDPIES